MLVSSPKVVSIRLSRSAMVFCGVLGVVLGCFLVGGTRLVMPCSASSSVNAAPLKPLSFSAAGTTAQDRTGREPRSVRAASRNP